MTKRRWVLLIVLLIVLALVGFGGLRQYQARASDVIVEAWPDIDGAHWLKANLDDAQVVVPDRPHDRSEIRSDWTGFTTSIRRTRSLRVRTNAHRLRGGPLRDGAALRIIALGDSVTFGWGVSEEEAWPSRLQHHLEAAGVDAEVLNAGVPASRIQGMASWCAKKAPALKPDVIVWTRRPAGGDPPPHNSYSNAVRRCMKATGAKVVAVLPPISTFDLHGSRVWKLEQQVLTERMRALGASLLELTPIFRAGQAGRGEVLVRAGAGLVVRDQETGEDWLEFKEQGQIVLAPVYELFEEEPDVREALFFDDGHPDVEGYDLMAREILKVLTPMLENMD